MSPPVVIPMMTTIPDPLALARWLRRRYRTASKLHCALLQNGVNFTYLVRDLRNRWILRIYRPHWRNATQVDFELDQLRFLDACGVPVSTPAQARDGTYRTTLRIAGGSTSAVLFSFAAGTSRLDPPAAVAAEAGSLLARMHIAQDKFGKVPPNVPLDIHGLVTRPLAQLRPYRETFGTKWPWLLSVAKRIARALKRLPRTPLAYGLIHGDPHLSNMHFDRARNTSVLFDFDCTASGWRLFDLATLLWANGRSRKIIVEMTVALLGAYSRQRPLSPVEVRTIPAMIAVRHLWWMGFQAEGAPRHSMDMVTPESHEKKLHILRMWARGELTSILAPALQTRLPAR